MDQGTDVFGEPIALGDTSPMSGFLSEGCGNTSHEAFGRHTVCTRLTAEFLEYSRVGDNDLSTTRHELGFPGFAPGQPVVSVRSALAGVTGGALCALGDAASESRCHTENLGARGPQALRHRSLQSAGGTSPRV